MKKFPLLLLTVATVAGTLITPLKALAHAGHDKAPGEEGEVTTKGPITISSEAKANLGVKVEEAELRTIEKTLSAIGAIEAIPTRSAVVSSRIAGRVASISVVSGDKVTKGQTLVEVESRQVGNPPPRVPYAAPIDGVVTTVEAALGAPVEPDKNLLEVVDLSEVYAEGRIFEGQVAAVKAGQKVRVYVESFPDEVFEGMVDVVSGALDPESRTLRIWAKLKNPDGKLRPNMRARLSIVTSEADSVIAVPHSAILGEAGNLFAFVQSDDKGLTYERRPVVVGTKDDRYVEIIEGIYPGDKVVTLGNYQLQYVVPTKPAASGGHEAADHEHAETKAGSSFLSRSLILWAGGAFLALVVIAMIVRARRRPREGDAIGSPRRPFPSDVVLK
ncbi:MAG: efflux RND transporter periplasmic adaptor subunit [Spartobacteria bacterium]